MTVPKPPMRDALATAAFLQGPLIAIRVGGRVQLTTAADTVRREPVFKLCEEPYSGWF